METSPNIIPASVGVAPEGRVIVTIVLVSVNSTSVVKLELPDVNTNLEVVVNTVGTGNVVG